MSQPFSLAQALLALLVIVSGIAIGGGLYEQLVVMPLWAQAPPASVTAYYQHNLANPRFTLNQGGHFWAFVMPLTGLLALATLLTGLRTRPAHRRWRLVGSGLTLLVVAGTAAWFVPNIVRLMGSGVLAMSPADIASLTSRWVTLNWVRATLFLAAWLAALRALTIPATDESRA